MAAPDDAHETVFKPSDVNGLAVIGAMGVNPGKFGCLHNGGWLNASTPAGSANACLVRSLRRLTPNTPGSLRSANTANIAGSTCTLHATSHKRPPGILQFHQFRCSFDVLAFVMKAAAVAIAKKKTGGLLAMMRHAPSSNNSRNPVNGKRLVP